MDVLDHRLVHNHRLVDPVHRNFGVPPGSGHVWVELGNHCSGMAHKSLCNVCRNPDIHEAMFVGHADLDQGHIHGEAAIFQQLGRLAREMRI